MDLRQLEVFAAVVERGSFSRAAASLFLSQPTVSAHVASLERELGVKLLERRGRELQLTPAGRALYRKALEILRLRAEALRDVASAAGEVEGLLTVGASSIPAVYLLPRAIARFLSSFPSVRVVVRQADTSEVVDRVLSGDLEIGVVGSKVESPDLSFHPLFQDELVVLTPSSLPLPGGDELSPGDLLSLPFVSRERGSGTRDVFEKALLRAGVDPSGLKVVAEVGSSEAVLQAVHCGLGIGVVSRLVLRPDLKVKEAKVKGLQLKRPFYLVRSSATVLSPAASAMAEFLLSPQARSILLTPPM